MYEFVPYEILEEASDYFSIEYYDIVTKKNTSTKIIQRNEGLLLLFCY